jgi:hypothetical protein
MTPLEAKTIDEFRAACRRRAKGQTVTLASLPDEEQEEYIRRWWERPPRPMPSAGEVS